MSIPDIIGYFLLCITYGSIIPWFFGAPVYGIIITVGTRAPIPAEKRKLYTRFIISYLIATPIVFTIIAILEDFLKIPGMRFDAVDLPGSSTIAIFHAFVMWAIVSFLLGRLVSPKKAVSIPEPTDTEKIEW